MNMQFKQGTRVFTADGQEAGRLDRVVLDPRNDKVAGIVIRKGLLFTEDKLIPMEYIFKADEDRVTLRQGIGPELKTLPQFEETHYIPLEEERLASDPELFAPSLYWYPPVGAPLAYSAAYPLPVPAYRVEVDQNIPEGTVPLKEGARVVSSDEKNVGNVERIFIDSTTNKATHFLISQGLFFKEQRLVPVSWIDEVDENEVRLTVSADLLARLSAYREPAQTGSRS